jgi:hypothetical protein
MKREKLIDKVVKLFRLGDRERSHTTEGELLAAVTRAREIMSLHNISMVEVEGLLDETKVNELRIKVKEHSAYTRKGKFARYDHPIMSSVSILTDTKVYLKNHNGNQSCMFVGDEIDAHVAGELYKVLLPALRKFTRVVCGSGWSRIHTDYAMGFGRRVVERAQALVDKEKSNKSMALVLTKKTKALSQYMDKMNLATTRQRNRRVSDTFYKGYKDGTKMNLSFQRNMKK